MIWPFLVIAAIVFVYILVKMIEERPSKSHRGDDWCRQSNCPHLYAYMIGREKYCGQCGRVLKIFSPPTEKTPS